MGRHGRADHRDPDLHSRSFPTPGSAADAHRTTGGILGLLAGQTLAKAYLDVGGWAMDGFYDFARAYELLWKIGDNIILEYPLVKIASIVPSPQAGTSGRDRRPFAQYVADCNAYYRANATIGSSCRATPRVTAASVTGATPATQSVFSPYGYFEEDVTYGGPGVQKLCGNQAVYELRTAQLFPRGVKLGIKFELIDQQAQARASRELSINNSLTAIPGTILPDSSIATTTTVGSGANPVFPELTSASPNTQTPLTTPTSAITVFKIGDFYLIMGLMGHRVSQTFYQKCVDSLQPVCSAVAAQTNGMRSLAVMGQGA